MNGRVSACDNISLKADEIKRAVLSSVKEKIEIIS